MVLSSSSSAYPCPRFLTLPYSIVSLVALLLAIMEMATVYVFRALVALLLLLFWRRWTVARDATEPPAVPYWIPFLGHGVAFARDMNGFAAWIAKQRPGQLTTAHLAGRRLYVCLDPAAASALYRRSRDFTFEPFSQQVARALGATEADMQILKRGTWGHELPPGEKGLSYDLHHMLPEELTGTPLENITNEFVRCLRAQICQQIEKLGEDGKVVDLVQWVKRAVTVASSEAMFGTRFVQAWPTLYDDYWAFDPKVQSLMFGLPRWMNRQAYQARDRCLSKIKEWERSARRAAADGIAPPLEDTTTAWDEYWGMKLMRRRIKMLHDGGISEDGRAMTIIGLLFGLNSNAVPATIWACIHAFTERDLLGHIRAEIAECRPGACAEDVSITALAKKPHCRSLLHETLRMTTNSPGLRLVTQSTQLSGYTLRPNSLIYVHSMTLQRDASIWLQPGKPSPDVFWPERFISDGANGDKGVEDQVHDTDDQLANSAKSAANSRTFKDKTLSLRPFGGGQTICPGRHFALNEMLGGLMTLMDQLDVEVDQTALARIGMPGISLEKQGGMFPDRELYVTIRSRKHGSSKQKL